MRTTPYPVPPSRVWSANAVSKYATILLAGLGVLIALFIVPQTFAGALVLGIWGLSAVLSATACLFGVIRDHYRWEWMGCWGIIAGTTVYLAVTIAQMVIAGQWGGLLLSAPTLLVFAYAVHWTLDRAIQFSLIDMAARESVIRARTDEVPVIPE